MNILKLLCCISCMTIFVEGQAQISTTYEPNENHPFGSLNPDAPEELTDFSPLIGECSCKSVRRNPDKTWGDTTSMIWRFKYIMNGLAVQDEVFSEGNRYAGSIRQYNPDSSKWYVHYYSSTVASPLLGAWNGDSKEDDKIILYKEQKSPGGLDGYYRITFSSISETGFNWVGEWVSRDESFVYSTWKISCQKMQQD